MSKWIQYWLNPLLADTRFNDNRTIILLTFDETESMFFVNFRRTLAWLISLAFNSIQHQQSHLDARPRRRTACLLEEHDGRHFLHALLISVHGRGELGPRFAGAWGYERDTEQRLRLRR